MNAIETLMREHRVIERVLDALIVYAGEIEQQGSTDREELARFVAFIREFADACHHGKEEDILFEAMVAHGFPREGGPIAVMLDEHDRGRAHVGVLAEKAQPGGAWDDGDRAAIGEAAHAFSELLRAHIQKEDGVLYPMAEQHLPPEALERVDEACERYEAERTGSGEHERLHQLAEALVARHAEPARASAPPTQPHGSCCS